LTLVRQLIYNSAIRIWSMAQERARGHAAHMTVVLRKAARRRATGEVD
jgi:hypothetical protein